MIYNDYHDEYISLYGRLSRVFEKKYNHCAKNIKISVSSAKEFMQAMEANFPGFKHLIKKTGGYRLVKGSTLTHGKGIDSNEIDMEFGSGGWHLMPVALGCSGIVKIILGTVLIVAGVYFKQPWMVKMGIGLAMSGVADMLAPNPGIGNYGDNEKPDEKPSYLFDGPRNTVEPGTTIPALYGECFVGSITVSGGVRIVDVI